MSPHWVLDVSSVVRIAALFYKLGVMASLRVTPNKEIIRNLLWQVACLRQFEGDFNWSQIMTGLFF